MKFCGQFVSGNEIDEIKEIVATCKGLSRAELANTICELLSWKRPNGHLKTVECRQFIENLNSKGLIDLPDTRKGRTRGSTTTVLRTDKGEARSLISGKISELSPITLIRVESKVQRDLWYEYIDRYHYLGYRQPFGAQLRYFIEGGNNEKSILGCLQFSSPAWMMAPRDNWIQWSHKQRKRNLQKITNNSRFLIFPWVEVKNLASKVLSLCVKVLPEDWESVYGYRPVLMETLVDKKRFKGTCYKAANWIHVGTTTGRGRMDRENKRHGLAPKEIYLYPLTRHFRKVLMESS